MNVYYFFLFLSLSMLCTVEVLAWLYILKAFSPPPLYKTFLLLSLLYSLTNCFILIFTFSSVDILIPLGLVVFLPGQIILESFISKVLLLTCETNLKTLFWFTTNTTRTLKPPNKMSQLQLSLYWSKFFFSNHMIYFAYTQKVRYVLPKKFIVSPFQTFNFITQTLTDNKKIM